MKRQTRRQFLWSSATAAAAAAQRSSSFIGRGSQRRGDSSRKRGGEFGAGEKEPNLRGRVLVRIRGVNRIPALRFRVELADRALGRFGGIRGTDHLAEPWNRVLGLEHGRHVAGVSKISGLRRMTDVVEQRDGGDPNFARKSPGVTHYAPLVLERGVTHDTDFEEWAGKVLRHGAGFGKGLGPKIGKAVGKLIAGKAKAAQVDVGSNYSIMGVVGSWIVKNTSRRSRNETSAGS